MITTGRKSKYALLLGSLMLGTLFCFALSNAYGQETSPETPPAATTEEAAPVDEPAPAGNDASAESADAPATADTSAAAEPSAEAAPDSEAATPPADTKSDTSAVTAAPDDGEIPPADGQTTTADSEATPSAEPSTKETALPAGKTQPSVAEQLTEEAGETDAAAADDSAAAAAVDGGSGSALTTFLLGIGIIALFVVPILIGNYLARVWKMPDHGWKFAVVLIALAASIVICTFGEFKFGPDLAGGITLVYELADSDAQPVDAKQPVQPGQEADPEIRAGGREFTLNQLIGELKRRLDPDGTKEITIRKYGPAVEIIIPQTGEAELPFVKRRITDMGQLEFRITADPNFAADKPKISEAMKLPPSQRVLRDAKGNAIAEWVAYDVDQFGPVDQADGFVKRMAGKTPEALVLIDSMNVTGKYLTSASKGLDETARPAVNFSFDAEGARRFGQLTGQNLPNPAQPNQRRRLGIILDNKLLNAPEIRERITGSGQISGRGMSEAEVDHVITILDAGALSVALNDEPISQSTISPTLGGQTIEQGTRAIVISLIAVVLFMLFYYRFAGIVACLALTFNLLLVLALMVLIKAAFTLPGLAGLVLTIGMSVDANVLIYERIREELRGGAALRMAIRNGFSRAMSAIIDSNVTTIISGIALYYIGTDQVKGFAVTLILGILTSMFTAIFFARVVFDVAERRGWIKQLRMMSLMSTPNIDFLKYRWVTASVSIVIIAIGFLAFFSRGQQMLDIDFTGGSSVTFTLNAEDRMPIDQVRDALEHSELADKNLVIVELGQNDVRYTIDSSASVNDVKQVVMEEFGDQLQKYSFDYENLQPYSEDDTQGAQATLLVNAGAGYSDDDGLSYDALLEAVRQALAKTGRQDVRAALSNPEYRPGSVARYREWQLQLVGLDAEGTRALLDGMRAEMNQTPLFPMANDIGGRVSEDMQTKAILATVVSLVGVVAYLWLRFQKATYGLAASFALVHDVLVTVAAMAISHYVVRWFPGLASALQLDAFQINLTIVAALLTIIGYSLNDTIVTFDRLREIKGKSPNLTPEMVNSAVNQTLSRTILTATTVFIVVVILFFFGGPGIHSFAFAFLIGVIAGTYSTVYMAAPVLLWLDGIGRKYFSGSRAPAAASPRPRLSEATR